MADFSRYAIYYAPEPGSTLDRLGAELLGYDAYRGSALAFPKGIEFADWRELTQDPRKYGFHATLKAPMALAPGKDEGQLVAACAAFAAAPRAIPVIEPVVNPISGFIALVPARPSAALEALAADCVRDFDPFRAALTEKDRARRNPAKLSPRQVEYLDLWGYPYVFEEFRFHMTLTGRVAPERADSILAVLRARLSGVTRGPLAIDRLALFRQDGDREQFRIIAHWPLTPKP
jgi:putative phosphonate metabolism protein